MIIQFFCNVTEASVDLDFSYKTLYYNNEEVDINNVETYINFEESFDFYLNFNRKKEILWSDANKKEKTEYVIYFLHGFNTDKLEGKTFCAELSKKINANVLLTRFPGNGMRNKESSFKNKTFYDYIRTVYEDLIISTILGNKIILVGSSTGCTYAIIASVIFKNFNIYKNIFFSPNLGLHFFPNIVIWFLSFGFGKPILSLCTDKIKINNVIVHPEIFIPLIGSLKAYNAIKTQFDKDYIIFIGEHDETVSNSKVDALFDQNNNNKIKYYYIFKDKTVHPILRLDNITFFLEKTVIFLNQTKATITKEYI